jgi:hypothetical protein
MTLGSAVNLKFRFRIYREGSQTIAAEGARTIHRRQSRAHGTSRSQAGSHSA